MPVKLFHGELSAIESEINSWEKKDGCQVLHVALAIGAPAQDEMFGEGDDYFSAVVTYKAKTSVAVAAKPVEKKVGSGEYPGEIPNCVKCGAPMALRRRKADQHPFFGCTKFPVCRGITNMDEDQIKQLDQNPQYGESLPGHVHVGPKSQMGYGPKDEDNGSEGSWHGTFDDDDQIPF